MNEIYVEIIKDLINHGDIVDGTVELLNYRFTLGDITKNVVSIRNKYSYNYALAELIWYAKGSNSMEYISDYSSFWKNISDDGITSNSAYGYIAQKKFRYDQIEKVIEQLQKHPESRRATININTPKENKIETKDEPCTMMLQFFIRDDRLFATSYMRSNDIWFGLPYDIIFFTELQRYIAHRLDVGYGTFTHNAGSMHIYTRDLVDVIKTAKTEVIPSDKSFIDVDVLFENIDKYYNHNLETGKGWFKRMQEKFPELFDV